ncbi:cytosolic endo-beta-N-acetylglucosaminidase [Lycorma delicatula]|uniref:cytosolic endo-beta-N-acetylglucosaminidase n=1 Tax=Lycorma delicatula TaxID=130591 RepID=UPI003F51A2D2
MHKKELVTFEDSESHVEECRPIKSMQELLDWKPDETLSWPKRVVYKAPTTSFRVKGFGNGCHAAQNSFSPAMRVLKNSVPKTIFCHDYKGGYLDDRFPMGNTNHEAYTFFHWSGIDTFIYFSHNLVTIPPLGWLNAGHRNGVSVLGTFITENDSGEEMWEKIIDDTDLMRDVINQLVEICNYYHFDGYFLNIENKLPYNAADQMVHFIRRLKEKLRDCCSHETFVIWYDSIIYPSGKLKWQNKLNGLNKKFFDVCDGIFLNYQWKPEELFLCSSIAGARQFDVYVGIDVFGRGCFEGGGFNTYKALEKVRSAGFSVGLFAPAWTHECCTAGTDYLWREVFFWHRVWKHLYIHGPSQLPFSSSFCIGKGFKKYHKGRAVESAWFNLAEQEIQLSVPYCVNFIEKSESYSTRCLRPFIKDSYRGGSCLIISRPNDIMVNINYYIRLFSCEFRSDSTLLVSVSSKGLDDTSSLSLVLLLETEDQMYRRNILMTETAFKITFSYIDTHYSTECLFTDPNVIVLRPSAPVFANENGWFTHDFEVILGNNKIIEIGVLHVGTRAALLGRISLKRKEKLN